MELSELIKTNDQLKIKNELTKILSENNVSNFKTFDVFEELFKYDITVQELTIQLIAELAKNEDNRKILTSAKIVDRLKEFLKKHDGNNELLIQTLRALGNLCFDNDEARKLINKDGLEVLLKVVENYTKCHENNSKRIITISCGFLYNLLMSYDELQKVSLSYNILELIEIVLKNNLKNFDDFESCYTQLLFILSSITEYLIDDWLSKSLIHLLVEVLRISTNPEISALCLELLRMQSENSRFLKNLIYWFK